MPYLIDDIYSGNVWETLKSQNSVEIDKTKANHKRDQHQKYKLKRYIRHNKSNKLDLRMVSNQANVSSEIFRIPWFIEISEGIRIPESIILALMSAMGFLIQVTFI